MQCECMFVKYCVIGRLTTLLANELRWTNSRRFNGRDRRVVSLRLIGIARLPNLAWSSCGEPYGLVGGVALAPAELGRGLRAKRALSGLACDAAWPSREERHRDRPDGS